MSRLPALVVAPILAIVVALCWAAPASAAPGAPASGTPIGPLYPAALADDFYTSPPNLADLHPGDVIRVRTAPPIIDFPGTAVTQIAYRSTNSEGHPITAVTTILTPANHTARSPMLSYDHIINALGLQCAPSKALYSNDPMSAIREKTALNAVLVQGWSVALPDNLGPDMAYVAGRQSGMITLDGIRAAQRVPQLNDAAAPVVMAGYSGGALGAGWAAALAPTYAPELNLRGVALGGTPANIEHMARGLGMDNPHPAFGLAFAAALGLEREYPDKLPISAQLNPAGLALRDQMANACTNGILALGAMHDAREYASSTMLENSPGAKWVLDQVSLEKTGPAPHIPVYMWHAPSDVLVPYSDARATADRWRSEGASVEFHDVETPDHLTTAVVGAPAALAWLEAKASGH